MKKNILIVAPPFIPVSKNSVAGIEQMVYSLGKSLTELGYKTFTIAREDSEIFGELIPGGFKDMQACEDTKLEYFHQAMSYASFVVRNFIRKNTKLDIIIDRCQGISLFTSHEENSVSVICGLDMEAKYYAHPLIFKKLRPKLAKRKDCFAAVANHIAQEYIEKLLDFELVEKMNVIPNGIITNNFPFQQNKDDYLLYLGRIRKGKAPHIAIHSAKDTNHKIVIAGGNILGNSDGQYEDKKYFNSQIKPFLNSDVKWFGSANLEQKVKLMQNAKALIFPSQQIESQSLVCLESMACGTPVIAYRQSKGPKEIIINKKTGYLVNNYKELLEAIDKISEINPKDCSQHVRMNFDYTKMGKKYSELIEIISK